jgi:hypothetical protein
MSAIDTFDWYNSRVWKTLDDKAKEFILRHRRILMHMRSEDEKKRYVFQYMREVQEGSQGNLPALRGG